MNHRAARTCRWIAVKASKGLRVSYEAKTKVIYIMFNRMARSGLSRRKNFHPNYVFFTRGACPAHPGGWPKVPNIAVFPEIITGMSPARRVAS
jgi:hypothetical protein